MRIQALAFFLLFMLVSVFLVAGSAAANSPSSAPTPQPTPTRGHIATQAELAAARSEWGHSAHADTFDAGQGANTTCASCKSPRNWDPTDLAGQAQALDCNACKRVPGAPRPALEGGVPIAQKDWHNVGCEICHEPVGDSYYTSISFWNQAMGKYEPVASTTELCAKCHEAQHGFQVIEEQTASVAHQGWECTRCHGAHGAPSACTNCHDPKVGKGAQEHALHPKVNCTACHDAGGLSIWHDTDSNSKHYGEYAAVRFGHALRSWTSHDLTLQVQCERCHHPQGAGQTVVAANIGCTQCHPDGAASVWCAAFTRNSDPYPTATPVK